MSSYPNLQMLLGVFSHLTVVLLDKDNNTHSTLFRGRTIYQNRFVYQVSWLNPSYLAAFILKISSKTFGDQKCHQRQYLAWLMR